MKENFAIKLRELRKASGMTQEQLAAEFGVSVQAVSKWETAASYPDIELMPRIADLFGVSLDELLADGVGMLAALLAAGNLSFWLCDRAVGALTRYYRLILKKKLKFLH